MEESTNSADVVIVGGGAAGCILAGRLASALPEMDIMLIESGPNNYENPNVTTPAAFGANLSPSAGLSKIYTCVPRPEVNNRPVPILVPNVLGGGSSINFMMYARPQTRDFDVWDTPGWGSRDLIPLFKKLETLHIEDTPFDSKVHGEAGPFHVGIGGGFDRHGLFESDCLKAVANTGVPIVTDSQDFTMSHGGSAIVTWIDPETGKRQDAAHVMIHPLLRKGSSKLKVIVNSSVASILMDSKNCANGVLMESQDGSLKKTKVMARKMVIITAGALNTPQILERSGIGHADILAKLRIPVKYGLPGVGSTYLDHQFLSYKYHSLIGADNTLDDLWAGRVSLSDISAKEDGFPGWNGFGVIGKLRIEPHELNAFDSSFQKRYRKDFPEDRPVTLFAASSVYVGDHSPGNPASTGQYFSYATALAYGYSKGRVHIGGPGILDTPIIDPGFLTDEDDLKVMVWAYKKTREFARRMQNYGGLESSSHPKFDSMSSASGEVDDHVVLSCKNRELLEDIEYSADDDARIAAFIRQHIGTMWHSAGTCPMKPLDAGGVVDPSLNVYGMTNLKIADLSILPSMVAANTYSTALLVGEKAAGIILSELEQH